MLRPVRRPVARRFRPVALIAVVALPLVVAGCLGIGDDSAKLQQQARAALTRWADAVAAAGGPSSVVLVGELTGQVGDWEPAVGDNDKRALMAGLVEADAGLPAATPPDGEVRWPDGTTAPVALISAEQAVAAIKAGTSEPCGDDCTPLRITGARLTTGPIETSRGSATTPVWDLTVEGTAVTATRVAIADAIAVVLPPWDPNDPLVGLAIESASGTVGARQLTVAFVGAPLPGDQQCGEDYTAEAVESDLAVVVIVTRHAHVTIGGCTLEGAQRSATLDLAAPLGERTVLEVQQGRPVPVTLTP
jgi:hypothetical protein